MINQIPMFYCKCDSCGIQWVNGQTGQMYASTKKALLQAVHDDKWHVDNVSGDQYCHKCYEGMEK